MDPVLLRTFKAVVEEGTMQRASQRLNCVQSNVTARIKQLEAELGNPVFDRIGRRLDLNDHGRALLPYADKILELGEQARRVAGALPPERRQLRLGTVESFASLRLAEVLLPFNRTYPDVELDLDIALTVPLVKSLLEHRLEAIVVASPATDPALTSEPVFEEEIVLISGPQADAITTPADVASRTLLQFRHGCPYRERLERWLSLGHATPAKRLDLGAYGAILGCVAAGMGVSLLPRGMAEPLAQRGALRIHQLPGLNTATTHFMWRKHASLSSAAQDFLGELRRQRLRSANAQSTELRPAGTV